MKSTTVSLCLWCALIVGTNAHRAAAGQGKMNAAVPDAAREAVLRADDLAARDRAEEAVASLRRAIASAPNYVNARAKYIEIEGNFLGRYDEALAEYQALMAKEPGNPVYPMALALARYNTSPAFRTALFKKVVELAPDWLWSHYARAALLADKEPETSAQEMLEYIARDGSSDRAYYALEYVQEKTLGRLDDAIATAEKMAARPEFRAQGLTMLWRLRLGKAGGGAEAKAKLRAELDGLIASSNDVKILGAARQAYSGLLDDAESARAAERKIRRLDQAWYPERGGVLYLSASNVSGAWRIITVANRQYALVNRMDEVNDPSDPKARIAHLESLLTLGPGAGVKRYIYEQIFIAAEKAKDTRALVKYGELLFSIDATDAGAPAKVSMSLSRKNEDAAAAMCYAKLADEATSLYRPLTRPANNGMTDEEWNTVFAEKRQRTYYDRLRSLALEAVGLALCQAGRCGEAEAKLRQAVGLHRTEQNLSDLANLLERLGRAAEAREFTEAAKVEYVESLKRRFGDDPAKDFELTALDGRRVKLSDLRGKVVVLDFWATWCGPCRQETPFLVELYRKYKDRGLEILYVSVDDKTDQYKIAPFAREQKIGYPVLFDNGVKEMYGARAFPTTVFIDRQGKVRYREEGFLPDETPRLIEAVVSELLGPAAK